MKKTIITLGLAFCTTCFLQAQPGPPTPGGGNAPTPFGFIELLIGAGALYGGKKAYDAKKKQELD